MIPLTWNIDQSAVALLRPVRKRSNAIVIHRTIDEDFDHDGLRTARDVVHFFTRDPEGVATVTLPGSYVSKQPTIKRWRKEGVDKRLQALAFVPYHVLVDEAGEITCTLPLEVIGAHAGVYNDRSIAVAGIGPAHKRDLSPACFDGVISVVRYLQKHYPEAKVISHDEVNARIGAPIKNCPGPGLSIDRIRLALAQPPKDPNAARTQ